MCRLDLSLWSLSKFLKIPSSDVPCNSISFTLCPYTFFLICPKIRSYSVIICQLFLLPTKTCVTSQHTVTNKFSYTCTRHRIHETSFTQNPAAITAELLLLQSRQKNLHHQSQTTELNLCIVM